MMRRAFALAPLLAAVAASASAAGPIAARDAWSRPEAAGLPTAVAYMTLTNAGGPPDRLVGGSTPKAARVSLHRSQMSGGMMSMRPVPDGLALAPGTTVALAPRGYHLMLNGLRGGLRAGETYPLTLRFAHARPLTVQVKVRAGADPMAGMAMPGPR